MKYKVSNVCQLLDKSKFPATHTQLGCTFTNNGDGSFTINGTIQNGGSWSYALQQITQNLYGHKMLLLTNSTSDIVRGEMKFTLQNGSFKWGNYNSITVIYDDYKYIEIRIYMDNVDAGKTIDNATIKFQLFDLTEMYGAGNEPTTVAQFRQDFPNEYYEYYEYSPECWKRIRELRYVTKTRNLFEESLKTGNAGAFSATTKRNFEENVWYIGLTRNNYNAPNNIGSYELKYNYIAYRNVVAGYGVARAFKVSPNTNYILSYKGTVTQAEIGYGYYDSEGKLLSYEDSTASFTTPDNCKWLTIIFTRYSGSNERYVMNLQLEEGSTMTSYQPYGYLGMRQGKYVTETRNLFDISKADITQYGGYWSSNVYIDSHFYVQTVEPGKTYYVSYECYSANPKSASNELSLGITTASGYYNGTKLFVRLVGHGNAQGGAFTVPDGVTQVYFTAFLTMRFRNLQLEEGSTATSYQPYKHISFN